MALLFHKTKKGQSLVEILLAMGLAAILLPALLTGLVTTREGRAQQNQRLGASAYLKEAQEAVRSVREKGWDNVVPTGTYHPVFSGSSWSLAAGTDSPGGYTRSLVISDVFRDASGNIVASGGSPDPSTRQITTTVSWGTPFASNISSVSYLTRYLDNLSYIDTTKARFDLGVKTNTTTTATIDGEVVLSGGGRGDWCLPDLNFATLDLPKSGVANALTTIEGRAFTGTGENASGVSFADVAISNSYPPALSQTGTFDGYKTNDIFGTTNYAYLATDNNSKEIVIIDLTQKDANNKYPEVASFNAPGNGNGNAVFVSGGNGFMTAADKFYAFNPATGTRIGSASNLVTLAGIGQRMKIVGNYAYIALNSSSTQLQIIDISNPSNFSQSSIVGWSNAVNDKAGTSVFVNDTGTLAYLTTLNSTSNPELFVFDVSTKIGNHTAIASANLGEMSPKGVVAVTNNKVISVGMGGIEYQVHTYLNNSLSSCGSGLNIDSGINGIAAIVEQDGDAYSYIITGDTSSEFKVIEGGPSGQSATSGSYESPIYDTIANGFSSQSAFNAFIVTSSVPANTTLQFQVAVATAVGGDCSATSYVYIGPDGTSSTFFPATGGTIPFDNPVSGFTNPGQCFRYKAYFSSTDPSASPVIFDVTVNYSP